MFHPAEAAWRAGDDDDILLHESVIIFYLGALAGITHAWIVKAGFQPR